MPPGTGTDWFLGQDAADDGASRTTDVIDRTTDVIDGERIATLFAMVFQRIVVDHRVMAGVPCIQGTRIPVATLIGLVAEGMTTEEIISDYPELTAEDVHEALQFAAVAVDQATLPQAGSA